MSQFFKAKMASGCLSLFFADQMFKKLLSLEVEQVISPALKDELGKLKKVLSAVKDAFLCAEGSRQCNKGIKGLQHIDDLEYYLCRVDFWVDELFFWVRGTKRERSVREIQIEIKQHTEGLEERRKNVFGGDSEGETSYGKSKDQIIQSLIPGHLKEAFFGELINSIGRRLLFENDDDDPDDVAIDTLRNIFYFKYSTFYYWGSRWGGAEQVNTIFPERVINDLSTSLMQRYALLPLPLKYCFDYCSLFPRDYVIEVALLVKLWMAQGFIIHEDELADEDVGRRYFGELLNKGFFQQVESDVLETTKCRMDSHAFALSAITSGSSYVLLRSDGQNYSRRPFHVSLDFHLYSQRQIPEKLIDRYERDSGLIRSFLLPCQLKSKSDREMIDPKKIRNIISPHHDSGRKSVSELLISNLDALRALELHNLAIQSLPDYIHRLNHLRYLDVSRNPDIKRLPDSITKLVNLQTLKLSSCFGLRELPKHMKNLINLRHLEIDGCHSLRCMPPELGQLTNLRTLSKYVLNMEVDPQGLEELGKLNNLTGELQIENLSASFGNACRLARLEDKHLHCLVLDWSSSSSTSDQYQIQLKELKPHMNLKRLTLRGYGGLRLSSWLQSLTSLRILVLHNMPNLEYISNEGAGLPMVFPSLRELWLTKLPQLKELWKDGVEFQRLPPFPCLSKLFIQDCPKLDSIPLFPTLEEELMLDSTSLKPFQRTLTMEKTQKSQASPPLSKLKNLSFVGIKELDDSTADGIPWERLTSLRVLKLDCLPNLEELPSGLKCLTNLKEFYISNCKNLRSLPQQMHNLGSLEILKVEYCPEIESFPEGGFPLNIKQLWIRECTKLTALKCIGICQD